MIDYFFDQRNITLTCTDILSTCSIFGSAECFQLFRKKKTIFSFVQPVNFDKMKGLTVLFFQFLVKIGRKRNDCRQI